MQTRFVRLFVARGQKAHSRKYGQIPLAEEPERAGSGDYIPGDTGRWHEQRRKKGWQMTAGFALFPTAIGRCGIAWLGGKTLATHLPEKSDALTKARLVSRAEGATEQVPPSDAQRAIAAITALLEGENIDLAFIECDFSALAPLNVRIYDITRTILPGETRTYGEIAIQLGDKLLAQAVGQALGRNPFPVIVPCHRVMGAKGRLTGFSANGGTQTKLIMLAIEGARVGEAPALFGDLPLAIKPGR